MSELIKTVLSLSVSGTLLLLLILGLQQLYKNKFSRRWQYYIWIVAALRFLLPFTPDTTIVGSLFETFGTTAESPNAPVSPNAENTGTEVDTGIGLETGPIPPNNDKTAAAIPKSLIHTGVFLVLIWAAMALLLFVRKITLYQSFIRYVRAGNTAVSDIKILNLLSDCEEKLNIRPRTYPRVTLYQNAMITSPMMTGFFHPSIILPAGNLDDNDLSYVLLHELVHYKHRDLFYKWLIQIVVCVHWFNPFVFLLEKEVNRSCELSCDEKVLSILDDQARRAYGDMLISFMKSNMKSNMRSNHSYKNSYTSVTLTEGAQQLKERLGAIMNFQKRSKTRIVVTTICTVAICFCFLATGAYAAPSADGSTAGYTYVQRSYYSDSYIIEMGWNLDEIMCRQYTASKDISLADDSTITVYFGNLFFGDEDGNAVDHLNDSNAVSAIGKLINSLKNMDMPDYPTIETPLITNITYVGDNLSTLAEEAIESGNTPAFSAIFPVLDPDLQREYCQKIYDKDQIAMFAAIMPYLNKDFIMYYADQENQDMKMNFFFVLLPNMEPADLDQFALKYYETDNIARFTAIVPYMTDSQKQEWLIRARTDQKNNFEAVKNLVSIAQISFLT